jgi:predicted membrane channel-forming protein YqfA (hemolysin III family)
MGETFRNIVVFIITLLTGVFGVPIIQFLKNQFGWEDRKAVLLASFVAFGLGAIEIVLSGQFDFGNLAFEDLPVVFTVVYTAAQIYYQWFKGKEGLLGKKFMVKQQAEPVLPY